MKKVFLIASALAFSGLAAQISDYKKAPNSYIFDIDSARINSYGGLYIPVKKAYDMWSGYEYLRNNGVAQSIPAGVQSASLHWEDQPGLVTAVEMLPAVNPSDSKIKVSVNSAKKGNAVIAFNVDGEIYWSWHIWVTDNPENGVSYGHGFETDANLQPINVTYMDRNLGATGKHFLGNGWDKSGGLMFEWGRKDPFPPLVHKDGFFYELNGEVGNLKHKSVDPLNTIPEKIREFNEIEKNIRYSVRNPLTYIINTDAGGNWFSSSRYKINGTDSSNFTSWDLWGDNTKGKNSNANSSSVALKNDSRSYELKSEMDPCPNGWRVPSYYGRITQNNNLSPFGRKNNWGNDDPTYSQIHPNQTNAVLDGIKVYPGLGMDFTNAYYGQRNMGIMPVSGNYVYYPNSSAPNATPGVIFQDNNASGATWSATFGYDGARVFSMISDHFRTNTSVGLHGIWINQTNPTRAGNAVRCMKDPNLAIIGNFDTEYFDSNSETDLSDALQEPNSFVVSGISTLDIPVKKAFAVKQKYFTQVAPIAGNLLVKVLWTTNPTLIKQLSVQQSSVLSESQINVQLETAESGNAVVALYSSTDPSSALWSWHLWSPDSNPGVATETFTTENVLPANANFVQPTASKLPPITTVFMDRNLGAISKMPETAAQYTQAIAAKGLQYQWGRKDPLPTFANSSVIYTGTDLAASITTPNYQQLDKNAYDNSHTENYLQFTSSNPVKHLRAAENMHHSVKKPMNYLYQQGTGTLYDGGTHQNDLTQVRDWVLDDRNQLAERWGHADRKSPFDPCPYGWRIPDVSFTHLYTGSKGNSPWYNGYKKDAYGKPGVIQDQWHNIVTFYDGVKIGDLGWVFNNPSYKIGNFPADGIRGELGGKEINYLRSGVWTASLADRATGYAIAMQFQGNTMQTGTGVYPQAAMGVRCARDLSVKLKTPPQNFDIIFREKPATAINAAKISVSENQQSLLLFDEIISYQIYDQAGRIVAEGKADAQKIDISRLTSGVFLLKIISRHGKEAIAKFIKR